MRSEAVFYVSKDQSAEFIGSEKENPQPADARVKGSLF
jgi:hypothetical protein